jgi:hypothetical protein
MFDPVGTFAKQFTPVDGGYLYYPSKKSSGKLITPAEFDQLLADWRQIAGRSGQWKMAGIFMLVIMLWVLGSQALGLPDAASDVFIWVAVASVIARFMWASFAPWRLVRKRVAIAPPRPAPQARRDTRALLNWPFVLFATIISAMIFFGSLSTQERTLSSWAWLIGSGAMLCAYLWIGVQKLRDRRR